MNFGTAYAKHVGAVTPGGARVIKFDSLTAIRTGWTETGIPVLVLSENPEPDEPQGLLPMPRMPLGSESVIIELPSPEVVGRLLGALLHISNRMAEHLQAVRQ